MPLVQLKNHTVQLVCSVRKLYEQMELTDCVLVTRGGLINAHKIILSVYSPYIKKLLMNDGGITTIDFKEVEHIIMKLVLDVMYYGEADVQDTDVSLFLEAAKLLQIASFSFAYRNVSETFAKGNSSVCNNVPTCVDMLKSYERNLPALEKGVMHIEEIEAESNSCFGNIDLQSIHSPETEESNILKHLLAKVNDDHSKGCIQNSCDIVQDEESSGGEDLQDELSPITFIAVPSLSVKCEDVDDEQTTSCISDLQLRNPLEDCPHESDTRNTESFKSEQEFLSELQIKIENEEKIVSDDARMGRSCSNYVPFITDTEESCIVSSASVMDNKVIDNEPVENSFGIYCLNENCIIKGTDDLEVKFESICEVSEFNLKEEKPFNTDMDVGNTEDIEPLLLNQNSESENYKDDALSLIGRQQDLNQGLDSVCTSKLELKKARVLLKENISLIIECANNDSKYSAMYETPASTSAQERSVFCEERKSDSSSHKDESLISKKQINFQPLVPRDPLHQSFKPQLRVTNDIVRNMHIHSAKVTKLSCNICCKSFRKACHLRIHMRTHARDESQCKISKNSSYRKGHLAWHMPGATPIECPICKKKFVNKYFVGIHMRIHSGHRPFECEICRMSFSHRGSLNVHLRSHTGDGPFLCDICKKSFSHIGHLNEHMRTHTNDILFECVICKKSFSEKGSLNEHMRTHTNDRLYECVICKKSFSEKGSLNEHMRTHTNDRLFECVVCKKSFCQKGNLKEHLRVHTGDRPFECVICKKSFAQKGNLNEHLRVHTGDRPFECGVCKKSFSTRGYLKRHMRMHTGDRPFECVICKKSFAQKGNLNAHMRMHTGDRPFQCNLCEKAFIRRASLYVHMRMHTGDRPFECDLCKKSFALKRCLDRHVRLHTGDRPFECDLCKKPFSQKGHLEAHMRTHTGDRPFECEVCNKKFSVKGYLKVHMRTHAADIPFECDLCKKKFSVKEYLKAHIRTHAADKPFECEICKKKFSHQGSLNQHLQTH